MAMIDIKNVSKWYGTFQVLTDNTTKIEKGEVVVVCVPSGSGKSTLIKTVNALEPFQKGDIVVDGISVSDPKTNLPKLRALAPEFYDCLKYHPSWSGLLFQFIFDERYTLFSRIERMKRSDNSAATIRGAAVNRKKAIAVEAEIASV